MNSRGFIVVILCVLLAGCGAGRGGGCACIPPPPAYLAVAQSGANVVAVYPLTSPLANPADALHSAGPKFSISAPGAESVLDGPAGLYVGESSNTITVFDLVHEGSGFSITTAGSITSGLNDPAALALSSFNGTQALFVANRAGNDVTVYTGDDNAATRFSGTPALTISGLSAPNGLAFDDKGDLWISQSASVVEFVPPFTANSTPALTITSGLQSPSAIGFDWTGTMYVADKAKNALVVYPAGSTAPSLTLTGGISGPASLLSSTGSFLYVANAADLAEYRLPLASTSQPFATDAVDINHPTAITEFR